MRGHFLSGTRKLNRHYQSGNAGIKPWLVTAEEQVTVDSSYWIGFNVNKEAYLNGMYFGCTPYFEIKDTYVVPFQFKFTDDKSGASGRYYVYTDKITEMFPFSGELPLYKEFPVGTVTQVGTVTLTREDDTNRWKITTDYKLKIVQFQFLMTLNVTTETTLTKYIGYKKEVIENA